MNCVSLVCTVHDEMGLANVSELLALLERIQPEVIFLEVPSSAFEDYYEKCIRQNLESKVVSQYRKSHQVELVPVDLPTPAEDFFSNVEYLHRRIKEESPEYRRLMKWDTDNVSTYGFAYLNSEHCSELWSGAYKEMVSTIKSLDDPRLVEVYDEWHKTNEFRETEMMKTIQEYCRENTWNKGVFLVGAAHRQAVIDISKEQSAVDSAKIQWDFDGHMTTQSDA